MTQSNNNLQQNESQLELTVRQKAGLAQLDLLLQGISDIEDPFGHTIRYERQAKYWESQAEDKAKQISECIKKYNVPSEFYTPLIEKYFKEWTNNPPYFNVNRGYITHYEVINGFIQTITDTLFPDI